MRVVVIGGGIVGAHVAAELARRGAGVTLVDRGEEGGSTSERSFAWINCSNPDVEYLELRVRAVRAWGQAVVELGQPSWLSLPGTFTWSESDARRRRIEQHVRLLEALDRRPERLTVEAGRRRAPGLVVAAGVDTIYHFGGEGWVLTREAISALLARGTAAGMRVRSGADVRRLIVEDVRPRVAGVELASGEQLRADMVVSCVGRFTESLLRPAGVEVPMIAPSRPASPAIGLVVLTTPVPTPLDFVVHADGLSVRPDRDGRLVVHSAAHDERVPLRPPVPQLLCEEIVALARRHLRHAEHARAVEARICVRPLAVDWQPVVGSPLEGLYVIATHSGVTLAPALAQLAANELVDGADEPVLAAFRPRRFERSAESRSDGL